MNSYPSLPEDTRRAASALYGKGHIYLRLGDHLEELLVDLVKPEMKSWGEESRTFEQSIQSALLTVFQFIEELANQPMLEAVRNRVDLKYALHLPLNSPNRDPQELCDFRKQLFIDPARLRIFQDLLDRLNKSGLFASAQLELVDASQLLAAVCTMNRFDEVVEAMYRVLEALAITDPEWLRQVASPYWYDRYNRRRKSPPISITDPRWNTRVLQIGVDIRYLLGEIDKSNHSQLTSLEEIKEVRKIWNEQFMLISTTSDHLPVVQWGVTRCASCRMLSDVNIPTNPNHLFNRTEKIHDQA